ncbi:hypothetical protein [Bradyrhizobium sp. S3.9.1]|uniref:hypothetical protein n=1 Tax=Bradyrhizobium sp. S3.9.1 TaxID=3156431 RepID=UPI00339087E3
MTKPNKPAPRKGTKGESAKVDETQPSAKALCPPPPELDKNSPQLSHLGGSKHDEWNQVLCNQVLKAGWYGHDPDLKTRQDAYYANLAFLAGVSPKDVIEGMMAAQLFASHAAAMECYRRAALPEQTLQGRDLNLRHAAKLTRANAAHVEALAKHRNKGQQKVTVEHVHVYQGGQAAFIANVSPGEGAGQIQEGQPHAVGYAPSASLRCADPLRQALPSTRDAERSLQDARRPVSGSA